jgi:hypothetical protein
VRRRKEQAKVGHKEDNEEQKKEFIRNSPCQKRCRIRKKEKTPLYHTRTGKKTRSQPKKNTKRFDKMKQKQMREDKESEKKESKKK